MLFREGFADRDYLARYTDCPDELETHLKTRTPEWASAISGVPVEEIEAFARLVGQTKRSFFRLGYGFTRSRNGAAQMHAASCIPAVTGAWQYEGGGAFFNNAAIWRFDESIIEGHDAIDPSTRVLDQSKIGRILTGDAEALRGGGPVKAMLIQNTNPMTVAPEQALVRQGFAREDLFVAVHEQFMANIGYFKKVGRELQGEIVTLSLQTRGVRIVPETNRSNDNAPSHRIFVGRAEIGAAWSKRSEEGRDYLSLKLDDPSFNAPIYANLFDDEEGDGFTLIWSRLRKNGD